MRPTPIATTPVHPAPAAMTTSPGLAGTRRRRRTPAPVRRRLPTSSPLSNPVWPHRPVWRRLGRRRLGPMCPRAVRPPSVARETSRTTCDRSVSRSASRTPVRHPFPVRDRPVGLHRASRLARRTRRRVSSRPAVSRPVPMGHGHRSTGVRSTGTRRRGLSSSTDNRRRGSLRRGLRARTPRDPIPPSRVSDRRRSSPSRRNRGPAGVVRRISIRSTRTGVHRSTDLSFSTTHRPDGDTDSPVRAVRRYTG